MLIVSTLLPALAGIAVLGRFYVRRRQKAELLLDDWLLIPALVYHPAVTVCSGLIDSYPATDHRHGHRSDI